MEIISLTQAKQNGLKRYFTNKPCKYGHMSVRNVSDRTCVECNKLRSESWEKNNSEKRSEQKSQYYILNKAYIDARNLNWAKKNVDKIASLKIKYRIKNKDKLLQYNRQFYKNNTGRMIAKTRKYQTAKIKRMPKWLTATDLFEIECIYTYASSLNKCGLKYHVDHIIPLQGKYVSGLHVPENLQVINAIQNISKRNNFRIS